VIQMRLSLSKSKNAASLYIIRSTYENGKHSTKIVEKLGTLSELAGKLNGQDPIEWAKARVDQLNKQEKEGTAQTEIIAKFSATEQIPKNQQVRFNTGYLFLQTIYYGLGLNSICQTIHERHKFEYNLNDILSRLIYTRILYPSSKLSSLEASHRLIEQPSFEVQHMYRALDVIAEESDFIESKVYQNSMRLVERNSRILYYDCTNYFFEIEQEDGFRQYGLSKEHRPNPIVQMGLFMDGNGMPLAMCINAGAMNEQPTLKPIEERIAMDFALSKFIVCTDSGLGSLENRKMNNCANRAYIVTQSLKKMKKFLMDWALDPDGWKIPGDPKTYNLQEIDDSAQNKETYYKQRWIQEGDLEQKLIVSYSPKYKAYQREVREGQIKRAERMVDRPGKLKQKRQNDPARFVDSEMCTPEGEIAMRQTVRLNQAAIAKEEMFDGFYGVCTNLEEDIGTILQINKGRWEIEESFRILKSEFRARPVYLSREARIKAHFMTCFLSLLVYRILERKLANKYTVAAIVKTLREMDHVVLKDEGYVPIYTRTELTDDLHDTFGFRTDSQVILKKKMKKILSDTKKAGTLLTSV
jgi:transposase